MPAPISREIRLPEGSWDSHVHVVDESRFPFQNNPPYYPRSATVDDLLKFQERLGIAHVGLVCISIYGNDNTSIVDAMPSLSTQCRAVICVDPIKISEIELQRLHKAGVRGVRINLKTRNEIPSKRALCAKLKTYADRIRGHGWFLDLYVGLEQIELIADAIPQLGVRVVIDHMGSPASHERFHQQLGYNRLLELLRAGEVWVKISGTYRFSDLPDLDEYGRSLIQAGPRNVVWASDWPHTGGRKVTEGGRVISEYREIDDMAFVRRCFEWCDFDDKLVRNLFADNPARLWLSS